MIPPAIRQIAREYRAQKRRERRKQFFDWLINAFPLIFFLAVAFFCLVYLSRPRSIKLDDDALTVIMMDVGQGESVLIHTPTNNVLIDCGDIDRGAAVGHKLKAVGVRSLDCIINSHPHADHLGGAADILEMMPVGAFYFPSLPDNLIPTSWSYINTLNTIEKKGIPVRIPKCGDILSLGIADLRFLSVDNAQFDDLNNCSLGIELTHGKNTFFMAGDLEKAGEDAFLEAGLVPLTTILKCSHHGSNYSCGDAFLASAQPVAAMISVGAMNDYGHPGDKLLARLKQYTEHIFRTDLHGNIRMVSNGEKVDITVPVQMGE